MPVKLRWRHQSIFIKILLVNGLILLVFTLLLLAVTRTVGSNGAAIADQGVAITDQSALILALESGAKEQQKLMEELQVINGQLTKYRDAEMISQRLQKQLEEFGYWSADLALSLQNDSQLQAKARKKAVYATLTAFATVNAKDAAILRPMIDRYCETSDAAVDSYTDDDRAKGNKLSADARRRKIEISKKLAEVGVAVEQAVQEATRRSEEIFARIRASSEAVIQTSRKLSESRALVENAAAQVGSGNTAIRLIVYVAMLAGVTLGFTLSLWFGRAMARRIQVSKQVLDTMAKGDLTSRFEDDARDELGNMGQSLTHTLGSLREAFQTIGDNGALLTQASETLSKVSDHIGGQARNTSDQAVATSEAANRLDASVQSVTAGLEEMGASISEIAKTSASAAGIANQAVQETETANQIVVRLQQDSEEINAIVGLISTIAAQTNLLALNATIEAARAGTAGRGFAVVASEVKELAKKTATATVDIQRRITAIHASSSEVSAATIRVAAIIKEINACQSSIAAAVEEQAATTSELSRSMTDAASQARNITGSTTSVAGIAQETAITAGETAEVSQTLARLAEELKRILNRFQTK